MIPERSTLSSFHLSNLESLLGCVKILPCFRNLAQNKKGKRMQKELKLNERNGNLVWLCMIYLYMYIYSISSLVSLPPRGPAALCIEPEKTTALTPTWTPHHHGHHWVRHHHHHGIDASAAHVFSRQNYLKKKKKNNAARRPGSMPGNIPWKINYGRNMKKQTSHVGPKCCSEASSQNTDLAMWASKLSRKKRIPQCPASRLASSSLASSQASFLASYLNWKHLETLP